ncbi:MAG: D-alanine--D-alanine ligase [Alphaproteobacteria bacterium]
MATIHNKKKTVAVFFGGQSIEHDVSILTGLQIMDSLDPSLYEILPVYVATNGAWYTGDLLRNKSSYALTNHALRQLTKIQLPLGQIGRPFLEATETSGLFGKRQSYGFDIAFPAFHGTFGEDGSIQGAFEFAHIPFVGSGAMASSSFMNKNHTKFVAHALGIPVLPATIIHKPQDGLLDVTALARQAMFSLNFPVCAKPNNLGSSVGVHKCNSETELATAFSDIFKLDDAALIEPFVENLVEYNIAVCRAFDEKETAFSAIERPVRQAELLNFQDKYLQGGAGDSKINTSEGMASATRVIHPTELSQAHKDNLRGWAAALFSALNGRGTARIDFLCNSATAEIWLNEINPIPGSLAYFLWQQAEKPISFPQLLNGLIEEGWREHQKRQRLSDPRYANAQVFKRAASA